MRSWRTRWQVQTCRDGERRNRHTHTHSPHTRIAPHRHDGPTGPTLALSMIDARRARLSTPQSRERDTCRLLRHSKQRQKPYTFKNSFYNCKLHHRDRRARARGSIFVHDQSVRESNVFGDCARDCMMMDLEKGSRTVRCGVTVAWVHCFIVHGRYRPFSTYGHK